MQFVARNRNVVDLREQTVRGFDGKVDRTTQEITRRILLVILDREFLLDLVFHFTEFFEEDERLVELLQCGDIIVESLLNLLSVDDDLIEFGLGESMQKLRVLTLPAEDERAKGVDDRNSFDAHAADLHFVRKVVQSLFDLNEPFQFALQVRARFLRRDAVGIDGDRVIIAVFVLSSDGLVLQLRIIVPEKIECANVLNGAFGDVGDVGVDRGQTID